MEGEGRAGDGKLQEQQHGSPSPIQGTVEEPQLRSHTSGTAALVLSPTIDKLHLRTRANLGAPEVNTEVDPPKVNMEVDRPTKVNTEVDTPGSEHGSGPPEVNMEVDPPEVNMEVAPPEVNM